MTPARRLRRLGLLAMLAALSVPAAAVAVPPTPGAYQQNDFAPGHSFNIVPPGQNGTTTAADAANFLSNGARPPHQYDQNDMYANLVYKAPNLKFSQILNYYKDASFGVRPAQVERTYQPNCVNVLPPSANSPHCDDVTIQRDQFGIPHVYGSDRAGLMFGLGYVTGEDRLFLADVLRHAGRADLSSFAGGANAGQDRETFASAPYANDGELQIQYDQADDLYGTDGIQVQKDVQNYVDGMNQWIAETRVDPTKLDALYDATNHPTGPDPWKVTDVVATGTLVAGVFGNGGGGELTAATSLQQAKEVLGKKKGKLVWKDFASLDDPEAPRTVNKKVFPYRTPGGTAGIALPDRGTVEGQSIVAARSGSPSARANPDEAQLDGLQDIHSSSNALLVSARESRGGKPVAVIGPQTGYFAPQLLMEQDGHAPSGPEGPAIDARGVSFVGTNMYVQLGRGRDYSWSATSAGQDIIDTFAVKLCEPGGGAPTRQSHDYIWNGQCIPMDVLEHTNSWTPSAADSTAAGSETLRAYRTNVGIVSATAKIKGKPYAYARLRSTYKREVDAASSFADWNSPDKIHGPKDWIKSAYKDDLTFNWFYVDNKHIAYYNSGGHPVRAKGTPAQFPVMARAKYLWRDYNPALNTFRRAPSSSHAQVIDQRFLTSWNNKQALGYNCDGIRCYSSLYRNKPLDDRIRRGIKGKKKMSLVGLINAMEDAGTVDDRGAYDVPWALKVLKTKKSKNPLLNHAVGVMRHWVKTGAHRRDADNSGSYDQAEAVKIMDAWWPLWIGGEFTPTLGADLKETLVGSHGAIHDAPGKLGSAFNNNTYGLPLKDLRMILGAKVKGPYSRVYCGKGKLRACRKMLQITLLKAAATTANTLYGSGGCTLNNGTHASAQMCHDAVDAADVTVSAVGKFHWINRPTFQQAVQYQSHRP